MTLEAHLSALAAGPKPYRVVTTYSCGKARELACHSAGSAENHAFGERRKIGRDLIDRETGDTVRVVAVDVLGA